MSLSREKIKQSVVSKSDYYDIVIVGGGASGLGAAVDSASRGYSTLLLEQHDFSKGTSVGLQNWFMAVYVICSRGMYLWF